jgi:CHAT domain-containing protein
VTVTLWPVETFSAKALNVGMFEHLAAGQPPVQALRAIKLRMLRGEKNEEYTHPYYWAPFVLFGDGQ